jgi:hypothetical protein
MMFHCRHAVLVDPLVPRMAACLRSDDVALRKHALVLMVQLLQEDYVKLKHGLIFFLLRMLCDPEPELQVHIVMKCKHHICRYIVTAVTFL